MVTSQCSAMNANALQEVVEQRTVDAALEKLIRSQ